MDTNKEFEECLVHNPPCSRGSDGQWITLLGSLIFGGLFATVYFLTQWVTK